MNTHHEQDILKRNAELEKELAAKNHELEIETALEKVRAVAMAMRKADDLMLISEVIYKQLSVLGFSNVRNVQIAIDNDEKQLYNGVEYSEYYQNRLVEVPYDSSPMFREIVNELKKSNNAFYQKEIRGKDFEDWRNWRINIDPKNHPDIASATSMCFYLHSVGAGMLGISTFNAITNDQLEILKRLRNVFELSYKRYIDIEKAEAQAREAQIELALERVRARTMAMQKSDELREAVLVIYQQLQELDFGSQACNIIIIDKVTGDEQFWVSGFTQEIFPESYHVPRLNHHYQEDQFAAWRNGVKYAVFEYTGNEKEKFDKIFFTQTDFRNIPEQAKQFMIGLESVKLSTAFTTYGSLQVLGPEPLSKEKATILKRFAKVFEQTYTRFLDLQKAEVQARESQIQLALERVRARTMAMQKSDELPETSLLLFQQVKELGETTVQNSIGIVNEDAGFVELSTTVHGHHLPHTLNVPINDPYVMAKAVAAWKAKRRSLKLEFVGEELKDYNDHRNSFFETKVNFPEDQWIVNIIFFSKGWLSFSSNKNISGEAFDLLKRFAAVFEQTYIRFNDLKQAEEQARESQVQLALERVRARTMAMQKSDELMETAVVLFDQLKQLGEDIERTIIGIMNEEERVVDVWATRPDGSQMEKMQKFPIDEPIVMQKVFAAWGQQKKSIVIDLRGDELESYFQFLKSRGPKLERENFGERRVENFAFFSKGMLGVINVDPNKPANVGLYERFAAVFDQTYKRFLDLQKSEAQAREAQIETALERVRSRSMAMHKSDDLHEVIKVVTEQLFVLGLKFNVANFAKIDPDGSWDLWLSTPDQAYPALIHVPYLDHPIFNHITEQITKKSDFYTDVYAQEETNIFFHHFFENTIAKNSPEERKQFVYSSKGFARSLFLTKNIWFSVGRYDATPFAEEENAIFKRFANVFEQAYTRFLDLQKAEAQAREADIELSLERVRAKTMAMQKPSEFVDVINIIGEQFIHLGFDIDWANFGANGFAISEGIDIWNFAVIPGASPISARVFIPYFDHPVFTNSAANINEFLNGGRDLITVTFDKQTKDTWLDHLFTKTIFKDVPQEYRVIQYAKSGYTTSNISIKDTWLSIGKFDSRPFTDEQHLILRRFANAFGQAYTRFLDLQKAEAQAREAQIEAGLERVRSRAMAMQTSEELRELIGTVFTELTKLDLVLTRCLIMIYDPKSNDSVWWMANSEAPTQPIGLKVQYHDRPTYLAYVNAWKEKELKWTYTLEGNTKKEWDDFLFVETELSHLPDFVIAGMKAPDRVYLNASFNSFGNLTLATLDPLSDEHFDIMLRFAKVFDLTYTRFNDLKQAESQAKESKIQLALERVRARTMAMQKSNELTETSFLLSQQFKELGSIATQMSIGIIKEKENVMEMSATIDGSKLDQVVNVSLQEPIVMKKLVVAWKEQKGSLIIDLSGDELKKYNDYRNSIGKIKFETKEGDHWIIHIAFFSKGMLSFSSHERHSDEIVQLLERFAAVFDLTYTRFLDLQKAEAQTREAQIELALERVRARTMAMHKSEELAETSQVLFHQLLELGRIPDRISIGIADESNGVVNFWTTDQKGSHLDHSFSARLNERTTIAKTYQAWKEQKKSLVVDLHGEELKEWIQFAREEMGIAVKDDQIKDRRVHSLAFFSHGWILVTSHEPQLPDTIQILERFASVFNLTYRRFLDLQKAEAQAREAQIEASLERVRSRTMAMHKSEELPGAATLLFHQLQILGMPAFAAGYCIWSEDKQAITLWMSSEGVLQPAFTAPTTEDELFIQMRKGYEDGRSLHVVEMGGEELIAHYRYMRTLPVVGDIFNSILEAGHQLPVFQVMHYAYFSKGFLLIITYEPVPDAHAVFKRFAAVFDQTYTRFLDLQKAEAQAREAQIEASLERVRSKTMAMHNSLDVGNTVASMFDQLVQLGVTTNRCGILIFSNTNNTEVWTAKSNQAGEAVLIVGHLDVMIHPMLQGVRHAWKNKETFYSYELAGGDIKNYYSAINNYPDYPTRFNLDNLPSKEIHSDFFFADGAVFAFTSEQISEEAALIFKRFAGLFGQTYRRYLDLQKAEANAREAQIEAGLERVRAKAMAMHSSKDLAETLGVFYRELKSLSVVPIRCGVALMDKESRMAELTTMNTTGEGDSIEIIGKIKMAGHPVLDGVFESWLVQKEYHAVLRGNQIKEYYQVLKPQIDYLDYSHDEAQFGYYFMFNEGDVYAWTEKELTEDELTIYRRFTTVISLTYKRYKDLQQAEAQAREAKIEAGLERVRARTMAMHNSEHVGAATATMFTELEKLGIQNLRGGITIIKAGDKQEVWGVTNLPDGKTIRSIGEFDMHLHPLWRELLKAKLNNGDYNYYRLAGKDKENYINILNATPNYLSQPIKDFPDVHVQSYFFGEGAIWTNSLEPHSEEQKQTMKRFASVFSLTFRRYQDLKKAEAQAREATIEAALEKVRGKAMAMHDSTDLSVTTSMIITELRKLGISPIRCGVGIIDKETHKGQLYTATSSPDGDSLSVIGWVLLEGHPVLEKIYEKWLAGEDYFPELSGDSRRTYYEKLLAGLSVPVPDFKDAKKHYGHFFSISVGCLYAWADVKYNEDEIKILKRFASIIDLTFRRYFELQKSEENAKEAVKQAALDRIRADIASMRTINDLERITPLIWNELTVLGIPFIRCGVFIMDEEQQLIHTFLSTPDGKAIAAFHLPYDTPGNLQNVVINWKKKNKYIDHWDETEFIQFADILVKGGALVSPEQYLKTIPKGGFYLHFLPFLQGMLYVGNTDQLKEEEIELIQHVADAFSTAYARYEDFNKLEAAKQQVEKTLTDLKQAQTQLVQSEKMASLGEMTAGIAHEIQNPLNFVNNFSEVSKELLDEMKTELETGNTEDAKDIADDVIQNLEKINHHGKRADAIVKSMLQHSRSSSGKKEPADINGLADEYLRLAYHGLRAKDKTFNAKFETEFDNNIGKINIISQDIGRVLVNLINNAFYAVSERKKQESNGYEPTVTVYTKKIDDKIEIKVKDNGNGIPQKVLDKIFQPFFTTKPTGQGTGLGLSLAYDIVTKGHGGELKVETREGEGSEFIIQLPTN